VRDLLASQPERSSRNANVIFGEWGRPAIDDDLLQAATTLFVELTAVALSWPAYHPLDEPNQLIRLAFVSMPVRASAPCAMSIAVSISHR
jgi:hypothetical protein